MADTSVLYILFESAVGYGLFEVVSFDEIGSLLDGSGNATTTDIQRFGRAVKLQAFLAFTSAVEALENANAISEHAMTSTLYHFLELHLPKTKKKKSSAATSGSSKATAAYSLGVINPELANSIVEGFSSQSDRTVVCRSDDTIREIIRGCRTHFDTFFKGLLTIQSTSSASAASTSAATPTAADTSMVTIKAQLGLGHSYSRSKVKFNPARSDNMIIQSIAILDQLDKDINTFAMRIREWYSWHFPELKELVKDNIIFARTAAFVRDKSSLFSSSSDAVPMMNGGGDHEDSEGNSNNLPDKIQQLGEIVGDVDTAALIVSAAKTSMGMDCNAIDMMNIVNFTQRMIKMAEYRKQLQFYLSDKMNMVAPNLSALIGDSVAARLISKAGSLTNLAKAPASTVQILGAEKALFRALKTKGNTPKYGLIYHSTFIGRADAKNKGRISRYLANKCSIATRIDSFADEPNRLYGEKLRDQVEERLKFYETGAAPRRNIDVMEEVSKELKAAAGLTSTTASRTMDIDDDDDDMNKSEKKKKKKDKKRKSVVDCDDNEKEKKVMKKSKRTSIEKDKDNADNEQDVKDNNDLIPKKSAKKEKKEKKSKKSV